MAILSLFVRIEALKEDDGTPAYHIEYKVLNTRTVAGVPQNRERVFILGIRTRFHQSSLVWPGEVHIGKKWLCLARPPRPNGISEPVTLNMIVMVLS